MSARKLILVDGNAALYRSFFALPQFRTASGQVTNAVFGFVRMVRQIKEKLRPTHLMTVFDGGIPERRKRLLDSYKAGRPPMPDELRGQIRLVEEYLSLANVPWLRVAGEEADDVLATLACRCGGEDCLVGILTSDKDLFQLVDGNIRIVLPSDLGRELGEEDVRAKMGVPPDRIVDMLALAGDQSDNIDGVRGVGAKTAVKLLEQYGSVMSIFGSVETVTPPRIRESLKAGRDIVLRNLDLVRLSRDLPLFPDWDAMSVRPDVPDRLVPFFRSLELKSLVREMEENKEVQITLF